ncbi:polymer-forming cytoskeletal protein [Proteinivorax hydrogeniformans]|uniref:Polymer-forming cytoskeletal protein n=1 Tax=Proteinivorax hydrogeniformans TaxID=1826727 RepID=A0AAU8HT46_9FIRM
MFKKKEEFDPTKIDTIVGKDSDFEGKLTAKGILRIDGKVSGEIISTGNVLIGESGSVEANIKAKNLTVSGTIVGDVEVEGLLDLLPSAKLIGDIKVASLEVGDGAIFKGNCEMNEEQSSSKKNNNKDSNKKTQSSN